MRDETRKYEAGRDGTRVEEQCMGRVDEARRCDNRIHTKRRGDTLRDEDRGDECREEERREEKIISDK